jgi:very-short-patch-repair endonuclease
MSARNVAIGRDVSKEKLELAKAFWHGTTHEERLLWHAVRTNRLGVHFRRQQIIDGFIVDSYCHAVGLVIEVDGPIHDEHAEQDAE